MLCDAKQIPHNIQSFDIHGVEKKPAIWVTPESVMSLSTYPVMANMIDVDTSGTKVFSPHIMGHGGQYGVHIMFRQNDDIIGNAPHYNPKEVEFEKYSIYSEKKEGIDLTLHTTDGREKTWHIAFQCSTLEPEYAECHSIEHYSREILRNTKRLGVSYCLVGKLADRTTHQPLFTDIEFRIDTERDLHMLKRLLAEITEFATGVSESVDIQEI